MDGWCFLTWLSVSFVFSFQIREQASKGLNSVSRQEITFWLDVESHTKIVTPLETPKYVHLVQLTSIPDTSIFL